MKLTRDRLKQIIKEELEEIIAEQPKVKISELSPGGPIQNRYYRFVVELDRFKNFIYTVDSVDRKVIETGAYSPKPVDGTVEKPPQILPDEIKDKILSEFDRIKPLYDKAAAESDRAANAQRTLGIN